MVAHANEITLASLETDVVCYVWIMLKLIPDHIPTPPSHCPIQRVHIRSSGYMHMLMKTLWLQTINIFNMSKIKGKV